ncbi:DUF1800 domain-containing protein [Jiella sp. MQZ9-1]|uniref:DUF1800 domain-containing protein n=1 Tax=Jiella flava TaxID=2816857 RepID=A0A939FZH2_9HYPH|nr:DUF1800 domain-containing protein [Jiella flava]MBO0662219.1 DUF1800 domain-containing protein [Jiella flava]MCD2470950.1 DUF1800 domain-containing protein [Jiella flava]
MIEAAPAFAASRFGLGLQPGAADHLADDPVGALIGEAETQSRLPQDASLPQTSAILFEVRSHFAAIREQMKALESALGKTGNTTAIPAAASGAGMGASTAAGGTTSSVAALQAALDAERLKKPQQAHYDAAVDALFARSQQAPIGFFERLVSFWSNHFAVEADRSSMTRASVGAYEREAIRPHVLGRFEDMLFAVAHHPTMLFYLDNALSAGIHSPIAKRHPGKWGLNENYGRELMELHTIGVDGGYDQADVRALANALSGWTVANSLKKRAGFGQFIFNKAMHEPGVVTWMGATFAQPGEAQASAIIHRLAHHPATAKHLAFKLTQSFVADDPPDDLVADLAAVFVQSKGDLGAVTRALVSDPRSWAAPRTKLRTPQEFVFAAVRALPVDTTPKDQSRALKVLGQLPWSPLSPAGYPGDSQGWLAADAMTNRLDFAQFLAARAKPVAPRTVAAEVLGDLMSPQTKQAIERAESPRQAFALLLMSPEFQRR